MEKALQNEIRRWEVEAKDKIVEDLEHLARRHISKILYWHVNRLTGNSQSGLVPVRDRIQTTISDKERVKKGRSEHFENRDGFARKDIEENEKDCDTLDVK